MGLFHFLYTAPTFLHFCHTEINCESSSFFFCITDLCLIKAKWGKWFDFLVQEICFHHHIKNDFEELE